ncbi:MAG: prolipoprotein diacylglyceryl transferase [Paludibacter sp.]|nr:prolipoprotein diacylglyceryl transferase [Paludibacter sp.]
MLLNYITWNIDHELFSLGPIHVRWYGLLWAVGIWLALFVVQKLFSNEKLPVEWVDKLFMYTVIGTIVGARLGHCFFYEWKPLDEPATFLGINFTYGNHYLTHPWELLYVWRGGLASHGGTIGILIALYLYHRNVSHKGFLWGMDRIVIGAALTGAAIRLGNLMNSEIYGSATDLPWGFIFVRDGQVSPMHPTQIYEMIYCLVAFGITWWLYWKKQAYNKVGFIFGVGLSIIFGARFLLEFIKLDQEQFESSMLLNMGQILSIPFIIWGLYLALRPYKK